jgi:cytochrome c biogenesis protein CcmG/thiol:disulfide interchange protein DsbE
MTTDLILKLTTALMFPAFVLTLSSALHEVVIKIGDTAPAFSIATDQGEQISPQSFGGKALLLNFWATWCQPCQAELPSLITLAGTFAPEGLVVLAVSQDSDASAYSRFTGQMKSILTGRQPDKTLQLAYGTAQIPESYLIDRTGKVRAKYVSSQNWMSPEILAEVRSLL